MKKFSLLCTALATMLVTTVFAQNTTNKWYIGVGAHATDHTSVRGVFDGFFDTSDYSIVPPLSKITVARSLAKHFAIDLQASIGEIDNKRLKIKDEFFILAGLGLRWTPFSENSWFDPYLRVGANYHNYSYDNIKIDEDNPYQPYNKDYKEEKHQLRGKFSGKNDNFVANGGVGINFWFTKNFGLNIESQYNWAPSYSNDYADFFQHSAALVFRFGAKKEEVLPPPPVEEPVVTDRDGDGIPDDEDKCPDTIGLPQFQGCPDTDGDGIPDADDTCPNEAGPAEFQGCPDTDGDGIPDVNDGCPTVKGPKENNGCPWETKDVTHKLKNIIFEFNSSKLTAESLPLVAEAAKMLKDESFAGKKFYVDGHTDKVGSVAVNKRISKQRAQSVVNELIKEGIEKDRLIARGFGKSELLCKDSDINKAKDEDGNILYPNQNACNKENRRVVILDQSGSKVSITEEVLIKK